MKRKGPGFTSTDRLSMISTSSGNWENSMSMWPRRRRYTIRNFSVMIRSSFNSSLRRNTNLRTRWRPWQNTRSSNWSIFRPSTQKKWPIFSFYYFYSEIRLLLSMWQRHVLQTHLSLQGIALRSEEPWRLLRCVGLCPRDHHWEDVHPGAGVIMEHTLRSQWNVDHWPPHFCIQERLGKDIAQLRRKTA